MIYECGAMYSERDSRTQPASATRTPEKKEEIRDKKQVSRTKETTTTGYRVKRAYI
jgi:hypothetical protein